ncbi:MAG: integrase core domain-containing protein, partial [Polyangiaceae bacterium]
MPVQFMIAMVAYAINERMARRVEYLQEEVRVLKEALASLTGKKRIDFTAEQRRRLAIKGKALTPEEREACCQLVRPSTILAWFRQLDAHPSDVHGAGRFVKTVRTECTDHFVVFGQAHLRHLLKAFVAHYQTERYHQGIDGRLIHALPTPSNDNAALSTIRVRSRLGGLLNFYHR